MSDEYLRGILAREAVDYSDGSPVRRVQQTLVPIIQGWAGNQLVNISPSGSFASRRDGPGWQLGELRRMTWSVTTLMANAQLCAAALYLKSELANELLILHAA